MLTQIRKTLRGQKGQGMVEWILIITLVSIVAFVALRTLGSRVNTKVTDAADKLADK